MIHKLLLLSILSFVLISCGEDGGDNFEVHTPKSCSLQDQNQFIYDVLKDSYLWSDKVVDLNISLETNSSIFLDNFLYKDDRFSYLISLDTHNEQFESGTATNLGFLSALVQKEDKSYETVVGYVYANSPADRAGLRRSDIIQSRIDTNESSLFRIKNSDGILRELNITDHEYSVINTTHHTIFSQNNKKTGYFVFKSFVGPNLTENLDSTFAYFKENGVSDLIIDLRYNGGGLLNIASYLGSLIGGDKVSGNVFQYNRYNQKYSHFDYATHFASTPTSALTLDRIIFITSFNTASASESLINALKATNNNIEVISIGTATYGKPYGMHTMPFCEKVLVPIQFSDENADGDGDFVDGLVPTCTQYEDFKNDFADSNETLLQEALYYIQNGKCSE